MVAQYLISLSIILLLGSYGAKSLQPRFVGSSVASINDYPYQLSIYFGRNDVCGATIIAPKWAITSAYCLDSKTPEMINLRAGSNETQSGGTVYKISNFVLNPKYDRNSRSYDVALLNLTTPFEYGKTVQPIPVIKAYTNVSPGTSAVITGWGFLSNTGSSFSSTLRHMVLPISNPSVCQNEYGSMFHRTIMVCTGYEYGKKGICANGGFPLIVNNTLVGVFSLGHGCTATATVYTRLSAYTIRTWISSVAGV